MITSLLTTIGAAREARNVSPSFPVAESTVSTIWIWTEVPAGIVTTRGGGGGGGAGATGGAADRSTGAATGVGALGADDGVAPVEGCEGIARAAGFEWAIGLGFVTGGASGGGADATTGLTCIRSFTLFTPGVSLASL